MDNHKIELEIEIVTRLLDGFEYFGSGLCSLNWLIHVEHSYLMYADVGNWLENNIPAPKYGIFYFETGWSWKPGAADPRWYWLKGKLNELKSKQST